MYYMMTYDSEEHNKWIEEGKNYIYAEESNLEGIKYPKVKKDFFIVLPGSKSKTAKDMIFSGVAKALYAYMYLRSSAV